MIIEISASGGFGGLASAAANKRVDMRSSTAANKSEICDAFDPKKLKALADLSGNTSAADGLSYKIIITDEKQKRHEYDVQENVIPADMLDMIDEM